MARSRVSSLGSALSWAVFPAVDTATAWWSDLPTSRPTKTAGSGCSDTIESLLLHWHLRVPAGRVVVTLGIHVTKTLNQWVLPLLAIRDHRTGCR
jgi:hypothetical protein